METITNRKTLTGFALVGLALAVGGCRDTQAATDQPKPQAAVTTIAADVSGSTAFINAPDYRNAAVAQVGTMVAKQKLGDAFRIIAFGSRTTDRAVDLLSVSSGYKRRLPAVRKQIEAALRELFETSHKAGGDGTTNLLYTLENAQPVCTPRSRVVILSDGIEDSDGYSASAALAAGKPVQLPGPATPSYLKGCSITFIGIGVAPLAKQSGAETLPSAQVDALTTGWREYFEKAGVNPADIRFQSIL